MHIKKILVTGAKGNIGNELVPYLSKHDHHVLEVDIKHTFEEKYIMSDINNPGDLFRIYDEYSPNHVIHMAAKVSRISSEKSPCMTVDTNIGGLHNIIQLCLRNNAQLIYFSTSEVYGNIENPLEESSTPQPNNLYGLTKYLGEQLVKYYVEIYGLNAVIIRPFMVYNDKQKSGKDKSAITRFVNDILNGDKIIVHKDSTRSWLHISDFIEAVEKCLYINDFNIINIGHPQVIKTEELAKKICLQLGVKYEDYVIEQEQPNKMTLRKEPDLRKQKELLGFEPKISIEEGIKLLIENI